MSGSDGHSSGMAQLHGKAALVTGGAKGIGKAICEALIRKHVKVCIADIDTDCGNKTAVELQKDGGKENVIFVRCDITSDEQFEAAFATTKAKFGHLDILINNAGIGGEEKWSRTVDVNVKGTMRGTTLAFRHLMHKDGSKGGHVINMASILGLRNNFLAPAYCASKHAIVSWSQCWGVSLALNKLKSDIIYYKMVYSTRWKTGRRLRKVDDTRGKVDDTVYAMGSHDQYSKFNYRRDPSYVIANFKNMLTLITFINQWLVILVFTAVRNPDPIKSSK